MRKIDTSFITTAVGMPVKSGSINHLQGAIQDVGWALANKIFGISVPPNTVPYKLWGCKFTQTGSAVSITTGALFIGSEIYSVPAASFTLGGGQVAIGTITTTYYTATEADPVLFTDSNIHNVHQQRNVVFTAGTSGTGDFDYSAVMLNDWRYVTVASGGVTVTGGSGITVNSYYYYWKFDNDRVHLEFQLLFSAATTNSTQVSFKVPLPMASNYVNSVGAYDADLTPAIHIGQSGGTQRIASISFIGDVGAGIPTSNNADIYVNNGVISGNNTVSGHVSYKTKLAINQPASY
jgi:hypothetical protein